MPDGDPAVAEPGADTVKCVGAAGDTVTLKVPGVVRPPLSVTEQLTVVVPSGNVLPDAGVQLGVRGPSSASLAVAA